MSVRITREERVRIVEVPSDPWCDWCGKTETQEWETAGMPLTPINLAINPGEEMGEEWRKHACSRCFEPIADALNALGYCFGFLAEAVPEGVTPIPPTREDLDEEDYAERYPTPNFDEMEGDQTDDRG